MNFRLIVIYLLAVSSAINAATSKKGRGPFATVTDDPGLPVYYLLRFDSIGYTLPTREALKGKANLHRILRMADQQPGLAEIDQWIEYKWTSSTSIGVCTTSSSWAPMAKTFSPRKKAAKYKFYRSVRRKS